jgi:RNA polymerase sigma-B factor
MSVRTTPTPSPARSERHLRSLRTAEILERLPAANGHLRRDLLDALVEANLSVAHAVAARYRNRGIPAEDLSQVAAVALVHAAHRFDPAAGSDFLSYAVPCIRGEVCRYFRDHGWMVRPPRRVQELQHEIALVEAPLATTLGRPPRSEELAVELGEALTDIEEALTANGCFTPTSLDQRASDEASIGIGESFGVDELGYRGVEARVALGPAVGRLNDRERRVLAMRYFQDHTQQEIADEIGVTQMQVSRLLSSILRKLRRYLVPDDAKEPAA